jgi:sugar phosphate permease
MRIIWYASYRGEMLDKKNQQCQLQVFICVTINYVPYYLLCPSSVSLLET